MKSSVITIDGEPFEIPYLVARFLKVLAKDGGKYLSSEHIGNLDPELKGCKLPRLIKKLPDPIKKVINSQKGYDGGYRLIEDSVIVIELM
jgi:hypothetical protein